MTELTTTTVLLVSIVFFATCAQTIAGFGFALTVMPLITLLLGLKTAAPLVALAGLSLYTINLIRYHRAINTGEVLRLGVAAAFGVPLGIWGLTNLDESFIKFVVGFILVAYALYSFLNPAVARMLSQRWVYLVGFATGCLGGAYNTPGPPVIVYGSLRRWEREEFRAVLQSLYFLTGLMAVVSHWLTQHITVNVLTLYVYIVPALISGMVVGAIADRRIDHTAFRVIVLAMILVLGLSMILGVR